MDTMVRIGDREFPYLTEARCHTCVSAYRVQIEDAVLEGFIARLDVTRLLGASLHPKARGFAAAARALPEAGVSADSIRVHFRRLHHPWLAIVRQTVLDQRATEIGAQMRRCEGATRTA